MPITQESLSLADAKRLLAAAEAKAVELGIAYNIAVVDGGGHLLAFLRQDGALLGCIELAVDKAKTARLFDAATANLTKLAGPDGPLFGINSSGGGEIIIFGGGVPVLFNGAVIGAIGASAGTPEQDAAVVEAAVEAFARVVHHA